MEAFDVYRLYMSLKLHFTKENYDITKQKSMVSCKRETFLKRKDILLFRKMAKRMQREEMIDYFVANFIEGHNGLFEAGSDEIYRDWKSRQERLSYQFKQDLSTLFLEAEKQDKDPLISSDAQHPIVMKLYLGKKITLETVIILDKLFDFVYSNNTLADDFVWKDFAHLVKKYRIFLRIDREKYNQLWIKEKGQVVC
jgi:hypothetical protein